MRLRAGTGLVVETAMLAGAGCGLGAWPIVVGRVSPWGLVFIGVALAGLAAVAIGRARAAPVAPLAVAALYAVGLRGRIGLDRWSVVEALLLLLIVELVALTGDAAARIRLAWAHRGRTLAFELVIGGWAAAICAVMPSDGPVGLAAFGLAAVSLGALVVLVAPSPPASVGPHRRGR